MRKLLYGFLSFAALTLVACDYNNPNKGRFGNDPQSGWVYFDYETTTVVTGVSTTFTVPVYLDAPVNEDGLTVTYTIAGEGSANVTSTGQVTFESGELVKNIEFTIPAEGRADCTEFEITLTGTNRSNVGVGFEEGTRPYYTTHTVVLGKDIDMFAGTYDAGGYEVEVTVGEQPYELVLSNLIDAGGETHIFVTPGNSSNNLVFPNYLENFLFNDPDDGNFYLGTDSDNVNIYDPCTFEMTLDFLLIYGADQENADPYSAILVKQ